MPFLRKLKFSGGEIPFPKLHSESETGQEKSKLQCTKPRELRQKWWPCSLTAVVLGRETTTTEDIVMNQVAGGAHVNFFRLMCDNRI